MRHEAQTRSITARGVQIHAELIREIRDQIRERLLMLYRVNTGLHPDERLDAQAGGRDERGPDMGVDGKPVAKLCGIIGGGQLVHVGHDKARMRL